MREFNTNWDPYVALLEAEHNINELIKALNTQSHLFKDLSFQHQNLINVCKENQQRLTQLELEVNRLKLSRTLG